MERTRVSYLNRVAFDPIIVERPAKVSAIDRERKNSTKKTARRTRERTPCGTGGRLLTCGERGAAVTSRGPWARARAALALLALLHVRALAYQSIDGARRGAAPGARFMPGTADGGLGPHRPPHMNRPPPPARPAAPPLTYSAQRLGFSLTTFGYCSYRRLKPKGVGVVRAGAAARACASPPPARTARRPLAAHTNTSRSSCKPCNLNDYRINQCGIGSKVGIESDIEVSLEHRAELGASESRVDQNRNENWAGEVSEFSFRISKGFTPFCKNRVVIRSRRSEGLGSFPDHP
ncbi:hypothetical protein EVAR_31116_1 [Eumeta japonica]|uniref:Uncharacterized protein n=1 Tax=Eumeta variegata TaxID=151549 RepID=A0A4C1VHG0_EUMVA|nr:hypothetical protein EVAR_31116_1 [Eumeta japonica]